MKTNHPQPKESEFDLRVKDNNFMKLIGENMKTNAEVLEAFGRKVKIVK